MKCWAWRARQQHGASARGGEEGSEGARGDAGRGGRACSAGLVDGMWQVFGSGFARGGT